MITHSIVAVQESSQTFAVRNSARQAAERLGMDETDAHRVGLVATELATNLVKHATNGGQVLIRVNAMESPEVELIALDRGPGIRDVSAALSDGHSSAGSPGNGLGAIRRLSEDFDITSQAGRGTAVLARVRAKRARRGRTGAFDVGAISIAMAGETFCGDGWHVRPYADSASVLLVDGLGHGVFANAASEAAVQAFVREPASAGTADVLQGIHRALGHTRGAAAAIADVSRDRQIVRFSGIGNIVGAVCFVGETRHAVSNNGTLGHRVQQFREYQYPWRADGILVMHSDGLSARWSLDHYPGLRLRDPSLVAAILYRDFCRTRDDATILVARETA